MSIYGTIRTEESVLVNTNGRIRIEAADLQALVAVGGHERHRHQSVANEPMQDLIPVVDDKKYNNYQLG